MQRVTISLPMQLLVKLDDDVRMGRRPNRSAAVVAAVEAHYAERVDDLVREATIAYYRGLSPKEQAEDRDLARASRDAGAASLRGEERSDNRRPSRRRRAR